MQLSDFDYHLPPELIAQHPLQQRDHSRLMVIRRKNKTTEHRHFYNLIDYVNQGDTLVFNDSRVIPARLRGMIDGTERKAEVLLLKKLPDGDWDALVRPGRRLLPGARVLVDGGAVTATILETSENDLRIVHLSDDSSLDEYGEMPLPPYIHARLVDRERYQTVYSRVTGSAAAPTAGLHFTREFLGCLASRGINLAFVTLHVGLDTFQPVREADPSRHRIHSEYGKIDTGTAGLLNDTRKTGNRVITVGTTSTRIVEAASQPGMVQAFDGQVNLYILPGYSFKTADAMLTNFHLPRSTLLMMVSAFAGREFILDCYREAIEEGYRFYSFGDAMLIL
jgi:S-adenosylmethionine:tRNA ribosyltransferase-isomerase